jgi:hypothetical protein
VRIQLLSLLFKLIGKEQCRIQIIKTMKRKITQKILRTRMILNTYWRTLTFKTLILKHQTKSFQMHTNIPTMLMVSIWATMLPLVKILQISKKSWICKTKLTSIDIQTYRKILNNLKRIKTISSVWKLKNFWAILKMMI